jgi:hypothetical protein
LIQGTDSGPRAHLRGGYELVGGAKACNLRQLGMTSNWGASSARATLTRRACATSLPLVISTGVPVPAADWPVIFALDGFYWAMHEAPRYRCIWL